MTNRLYYGDNLDVLRTHIGDESVDLIYLDPPFNSNANYNILFKSPAGKSADSQIEAFEDTWHWNDKAEAAFHDVMVSGNTDVAELLRAMRGFLKENDMMAYLAMMAVRLIELHRVLKPTGSLYLHCDPTASHYLKLLLDGVFGPTNFRNEIVWRRTNAHNKLSRPYGPIHDTILFYSRTENMEFHPGRSPYPQSYVDNSFPYNDERGCYQSNVLTGAGTRKGESGQPWLQYDPTKKGRHWAIPKKLLDDVDVPDASTVQDILSLLDARGLILHPKSEDSIPRYKQYLDTSEGTLFQDIWAYQPGTRGILRGTPDGIDEDVKWLDSTDEKLGYPTQKPLGLLERILNASSNPGDVVLDPFCGCGTAVDAAQKLGRQWIGIDVTHLSIGLIERRLQDRYGPNLGAKGAKNPPRNGPDTANPPRNGEGDRAAVEGPGVTRSKAGQADTAPSVSPDGLPPPRSGEEFALSYEVIGTPNDLDSALKLAAEEPHQFQYWITQAVDGQPYQGGRKGADRGIDGYLYFTGHDRKTEAAIISVKAGRNVGVAMVRDLKGVIEREKAPIGIFICAVNPTREMEREAAAAGVYEGADGRTYPRLQLYTLAEYFAGLRPKVPLLDRQAAYKKAAREDVGKGRQGSLL